MGQNKVFYTIGSSGHAEGNARWVARATRHTDWFLHYRTSWPTMDPIMDSALSFAAAGGPASAAGATRCGAAKPLWVLPQTSTNLPKALGGIGAGKARLGVGLPIPDRLIAICCSATPRPPRARRRRSMPRQWMALTRSCRRRCCTSAGTTTSASR